MRGTKLRVAKPILFPTSFGVVLFVICTVIGFIFNTLTLSMFFSGLGRIFSAIGHTIVVAQVFSTLIIILIVLLVLIFANKLKYIPAMVCGLAFGCLLSILYSYLTMALLWLPLFLKRKEPERKECLTFDTWSIINNGFLKKKEELVTIIKEAENRGDTRAVNYYTKKLKLLERDYAMLSKIPLCDDGGVE